MHSTDLRLVDDVTRILQVRHYWKSTENSPRNSRPKSRITNDTTVNPYSIRQFKLPNVMKRLNLVERNREISLKPSVAKFSKERSLRSRQYGPRSLNQTEQISEIVQADFQYPMPSFHNTKEENLRILDTLSSHIQLFKKKPLLGAHLLRSQDMKYEIPSDNTFLTNNNNILTSNINMMSERDLLKDPSVQQMRINGSFSEAEHGNFVPKKLSRKNVQYAGTKFPYDLYMLNHSRKKVLNLMMTKLPDTEDPRVVFEQLVKPDALLGQQEIMEEEQRKKRNEFVSRHPMNSAYYGMKALRKRSQHSLSKLFKRYLPEDSRFYDI